MQKPNKDVEIVNVRLPKEIVSILDSLIKKNIFTSRSDAIREFSREYVIDNRITRSGNQQPR
ncbi:MAG: ribbon-helix-helix domain-containing protein [Nanoarchaeota archaeon]|nr:ribbon-helix-helix domain-containing protein [Nanoarchaeota archaeon]MBU1854229.1 ribbon-helix-helix domain-containing protein [Nanoarchaeota archaeon]